MQILYVPKSTIYPAFGYYHYHTEIAEIRDDLPLPVKLFVIAHEHGHSLGYGEFMSTLSALVEHPFGFIYTVLLSLSPYRLLYYFNRIFNNKK